MAVCSGGLVQRGASAKQRKTRSRGERCRAKGKTELYSLNRNKPLGEF